MPLTLCPIGQMTSKRTSLRPCEEIRNAHRTPPSGPIACLGDEQPDCQHCYAHIQELRFKSLCSHPGAHNFSVPGTKTTSVFGALRVSTQEPQARQRATAAALPSIVAPARGAARPPSSSSGRAWRLRARRLSLSLFRRSHLPIQHTP